MGDYVKIVINCGVALGERSWDGKSSDQFRKEFYGIMGGLTTSAYHCGGEMFTLGEDNDLVLVTQDKYGRNVDRLAEWLRPHVIRGMGDGDCYMIVFR